MIKIINIVKWKICTKINNVKRFKSVSNGIKALNATTNVQTICDHGQQ